jgi:tetratricopeptide (TPR) repeat protein
MRTVRFQRPDRPGVRWAVAILLVTLSWIPGRPLRAAQQAPGQSALEARQFLNRGVQAYRDGKFDLAIEWFRRAKELDASLLNARLYLAVTYASKYIPGDPSAENRQWGEMSVAEFKKLLSITEALPPGPERLGLERSSVDGIASVLYQMAGSPFDRQKFEESKTYHKRHIDMSPADPEPYYWVGVIDWTLAFRANSELRSIYNRDAHPQLRDDQALPPALREQYAREYGAIINEGIECLMKAIARKADYDDAMAYLNLLYRRKADQMASATERERYVRMADDLVDKLREIKQKKMGSHP